MNRLKLLRTTLTGLLIAVCAFGAMGISSPRTVQASGTVPSVILDFYCTHTIDWTGSITAANSVYVAGKNQYLNNTSHSFPTNYTWAGGNYWWYAIGYVIYYKASWLTGMPYAPVYHSGSAYATVGPGYFQWDRVVMPFC